MARATGVAFEGGGGVRVGLVIVLVALFVSGCLTVGDVRRADVARLAALTADERSWVREEAVRALGVRGDEVERVEGRLADVREREHVRVAAAEALESMRRPRSAAVLRGVLEGQGASPDLKIAAALALCACDPASYRVLEPARDDPDLLLSATARRLVATRCAGVVGR